MARLPDSRDSAFTQADATISCRDVSSTATPSPTSSSSAIQHDIEHAPVDDDPRHWSSTRKSVILCIISAASLLSGLCISIQNPANAKIEEELHTTATQISLTQSVSILVQGSFPILWSTVSEIKGRKLVYLASVALFTVGSATVAISKTIGLVIGMRVFQAIGASAVVTIGAATLADVYEPHQRGTMMGIYYSAPLLGPALGSTLGGGLTQGLGWRAVFWFLAISGMLIFAAFLFLFKDTFRTERSLTYQSVLKKRIHQRKLAQEADAQKRKGSISEKNILEGGAREVQQQKSDVEAQPVTDPAPAVKEVKLSIIDVNPFPPYLRVLSRRSNVAIFVPSALFFGFSFCIAYTCARTLSLHYGYDALMTGLVLLAFGLGSILGSVLGGRWSDRTLARLKAVNGGVSYPEMRLESTKPAMWLFPPAVVGYAWVCQQHVHVSAVCAMLFLTGFFSIWMYASTLAYIVDANVGQSSSAVATNGSVRGFTAFIAVELAVPLQDAIGDGGLYTLWAGLMLVAELMILVVLYKGKRWREASVVAEEQKYGF